MADIHLLHILRHINFWYHLRISQNREKMFFIKIYQKM